MKDAVPNASRARRASARGPLGQRVGVVAGTWVASLLLGCAGSVPSAKRPGGGEGTVRPSEEAPSTARLERQLLITLVQDPPIPLRGAGSSRRHYVETDGYSRTERTRRLARQIAKDYHLQPVEGWPIEALGVYCVVLEVPESMAIPEVLAALEGDERVESAQPMHRFEALGATTGDPYTSLQRGFELMGMEGVHRWADGKGVTVAIIDTGVDRWHEDLSPRIVQVRDFVGSPGSNRSPAERHGTAVAGVIVSMPNNGFGTVGVAPEAELLALRACWEEEGTDAIGGGTCSTFTLAKALSYLIEQRPAVLNLSLGGPSDPLLERLLEAAIDRGVAVVAAYDEVAGSRRFPESVERVLVVQAISRASSGDDVERLLYAPGVDILTTMPGGSFDFVSGSSFAAAHVSGLLALLLERRGALDSDALRDILRRSADRIDAGFGRPILRVDACSALRRVVPAVACKDSGAASPGL